MNMKHLEMKIDKEFASVEDQRRWIVAYKKNGLEVAREKLFTNNLKMVISIVNEFTPHSSIEEDCFQEGIIAFATALERFELERGTNFNAYAAQCIRGHIKSYLAKNSNQLTVKPHVYSKRNKAQRERNDFMAVHGRFPTLEEHRSITSLPKRRLEFYLEEGDSASMDGDTDVQHEVLAGEAVGADEIYMESEDVEFMMERCMPLLTKVERMHLEDRYGLNGGAPMKFKEMGIKYKKTSQRAEQVTKGALEKLRFHFKNQDSPAFK